MVASHSPHHASLSASPTDVHQLVQLRATTLIHVSAAHMALVHQLPQQLDHVVRCFFTYLLKLEHSRSLAVHAHHLTATLKMTENIVISLPGNSVPSKLPFMCENLQICKDLENRILPPKAIQRCTLAEQKLNANRANM